MSTFFMFILTWTLTQAPLLNLNQDLIPAPITTAAPTTPVAPITTVAPSVRTEGVDDYLFMLANKKNPLPSDFKPEDLIKATVRQKYGNTQLPKVTDDALKLMFDGAQKAGFKLYLSSGYRDYGFQKQLFNNAVAKNGAQEANRWVAKPGESEHQTGLAVDITAKSVNLELTVEFEKTEEYQWLIKNCANYGFILRYPEGQEDVTGYSYEPWHYRYIGDIEIAQKIMAENLTFEAYLGKIEE